MKWPPLLMKLRFSKGEHGFGLWIPLFLIGPIVLVFLLAVFVILLPFALLTLAFTWQWHWMRWVFEGIPAVFHCLVSLRGLVVQVDSPDGCVDIVVP